MLHDQKLLTVGEVAARTGLPIHRVQYLIKSRGLRPVGRAGNLRVFDEATLERVREAATEADQRGAPRRTPVASNGERGGRG